MTTNGPIYQMVEETTNGFYKNSEVNGPSDDYGEAKGFEQCAGILGELLPKIQELETTWIPVEERLPEDNREYLVITEHFNITVASCTGTSWFSYGEYGLYNMKYDSPTHWQPLPQPPTK